MTRVPWEQEFKEIWNVNFLEIKIPNIWGFLMDNGRNQFIMAYRFPCLCLKSNLSVLSFNFMYFGCAGSLLLCGLFSSCVAWASHCGGFSCFRAQALGCVDSVAVVPGL